MTASQERLLKEVDRVCNEDGYYPSRVVLRELMADLARELRVALADADNKERAASQVIAAIVEQCGGVVEVTSETRMRVHDLTLFKDTPPDRNIIRWRTFPRPLEDAALAGELTGDCHAARDEGSHE